MNEKETIYLSIDIETDGPNLVKNSMIMLGVAVSNPLASKELLMTQKSWCLEQKAGSMLDERTYNEFWFNNLDIWKLIKSRERDANECMVEFANFILELESQYNIKYIARPTSFDIPWVQYYLSLFNLPLLSHTGLCISTLLKACDYLGMDREVVNNAVRNESLPHTHMADDDAVAQLYMFIQLKKLMNDL